MTDNSSALEQQIRDLLSELDEREEEAERQWMVINKYVSELIALDEQLRDKGLDLPIIKTVIHRTKEAKGRGGSLALVTDLLEKAFALAHGD